MLVLTHGWADERTGMTNTRVAGYPVEDYRPVGAGGGRPGLHIRAPGYGHRIRLPEHAPPHGTPPAASDPARRCS